MTIGFSLVRAYANVRSTDHALQIDRAASSRYATPMTPAVATSAPDSRPLRGVGISDALRTALAVAGIPASAATATAPAVRIPITTPSISSLAPGYAAYTRRTSPATSGARPSTFNTMFNSTGPGWSAADATYSIPLPDGKTLWMFGDTMINTVDKNGIHPHGGFVRNSAVVQNGATFTTITGGTRARPASFLSPADPKQWYWPGHGIADGTSIYLFMGKIKQTGSGAWGFASAGSDLVQLNRSNLAVERVTTLPGGDTTTWGTSVMRHGAYTYVYGMESGPGPFDRWAKVARATNGNLGGAWEYWNGSGWTTDSHAAAHIADGVSNSYSVFPTRTGFAMASQDIFLGTTLYARTAPTPIGPWSDWKVADTGPRKRADQISYNALVHPEFTKSGQMLVSWNMNVNDGLLPTPDRANRYRPVFRAVPQKAFE